MFWIFVFLFMYLPHCLCQITSYERPDGSFSIGYSSESQGDTGEALSALLTYASGWTDSDRDYASDIPHLLPSIDMGEARAVFESSMNTLVENTRRILRRNSEVIGIITRVANIAFNYLRYIGRAVASQFNRWVSQSQNRRRIGFVDRF